MTIGKLNIIYMAHIMFLSDSAVLVAQVKNLGVILSSSLPLILGILLIFLLLIELILYVTPPEYVS